MSNNSLVGSMSATHLLVLICIDGIGVLALGALAVMAVRWVRRDSRRRKLDERYPRLRDYRGSR